METIKYKKILCDDVPTKTEANTKEFKRGADVKINEQNLFCRKTLKEFQQWF